MFKRSLLAMIFLLIIIPVSALAHTGLKASNPKDGETITEQLKEITLNFNTAISPTSSFVLKDPSGESVPVDIEVNDKILKGAVAPLSNGQYTIDWRIVGADTHVIEGSLSFTVQVDEPEDVKQSSDVEQPADAEQPVEDNEAKQNEPAPTEETSPAQNNTQDSSFLIWGTLIAVAVGVSAFLLWRIKR